MKTKNNVQKAILKMTIAVTSIALLSFTVGAQDSSNDFLAYNNTESIDDMAEMKFTNEVIVESVLELESWMTDVNFFNINIFNIEEETEMPLEVEDWMLNDDLFSVPESEKPLVLESWMIAGNFWD